MKSLFILICCFSLAFLKEPTQINGIYQLTYEIFDEFIQDHESVLVKFYSPNCVHCKALKPEFEAAAKLLQSENIVFAEVNCLEQSQLAEEQEINSYPTIQLYHQNAPLEYKSPSIQASDIEAWVLKKLGPQIESLLTVTDVDEAISEHKVTAIYFGNPYAQEFELLKAVALSFDDIFFGHTQDSRAFKKYFINVDDDHTLVLFKHFDDKRVDYKGPWDFGKEIAEFLYEEQFPLVLEFSATSAEKIFTEEKPYLFLLLGKGTEGMQHLQLFHSLGKQFKRKGLGLCVSKVGGELNSRLLEFLGVSEGKDTFPMVIYLQPTEEEPKKFRMKGEINENSLKQFVKEVKQGNEGQIKRSEETSENQNDLVVKIVASNWEDIVLNSQKDVIVLMVADWCTQCEQAQKDFRNAAQVYSDSINIVFGILDYEKNEIEGLKGDNLPLIKFYPSNDKSGRFNVAGKYDKNSIVKFVKTHHTVDIERHKSDEL